MTFTDKLLWSLPWICIGYGLGILLQYIRRVRDGIPATRRAISRDRRRQRLGLADVPQRVQGRPLGCRCGWGLGECRMCYEARTGLTVQEAGEKYGDPNRAPSRPDARITAEIGKPGDVEPPRGWQARVWARIRKEHSRGK